MKKTVITSFLLFCIFSLTILGNTLLAIDFINSSRKCDLSVNYSGMEIPPLLEEELQSENDFEKDHFNATDFFNFSPSFLSHIVSFHKHQNQISSYTSFNKSFCIIPLKDVFALRNLRI